ncbi:protein TBATA [Danio rerio]|uniref:Protein TBATA n=1 Tax=Danio rerio TaxID=7955 RepID=A0A8M6Z3N1_DANRE
MDESEQQANVSVSRADLSSVQRESAGSRATTRGSLRFGTLSHHSFFSRHNPHPHRVRHMQGLNGKPVCMVNDDWFAFTPLCPHPLIKSQVSVSGSRSSAFFTPEISSDRSGPRAALISESWREELKDLATKITLSAAAETQHDKREPQKHADDEAPRRKTQYSSQSGRIIPSSSWGGKKRSRTSHRRMTTHTHMLEGLELKVLELLCQILQTDSLSMVQQWLLLASDKEKELVQGLLKQAVSDCSSLSLHTSADPLNTEHLLLEPAGRAHRSSLRRSETLPEEPERIGEAEVLTLYPENT